MGNLSMHSRPREAFDGGKAPNILWFMAVEERCCWRSELMRSEVSVMAFRGIIFSLSTSVNRRLRSCECVGCVFSAIKASDSEKTSAKLLTNLSDLALFARELFVMGFAISEKVCRSRGYNEDFFNSKKCWLTLDLSLAALNFTIILAMCLAKRYSVLKSRNFKHFHPDTCCSIETTPSFSGASQELIHRRSAEIISSSQIGKPGMRAISDSTAHCLARSSWRLSGEMMAA